MITAEKRDAARKGMFYFRKTLKKCELDCLSLDSPLRNELS